MAQDITLVNHTKQRITLPDPKNPRGGLRLGSVEDRDSPIPANRNKQVIEPALWKAIKDHKAVRAMIAQGDISVYGD